MAGRGPAPGANPNRKNPWERRHRVQDAEFEDLPADGYQGEFPPLPESYLVEDEPVDFLERTREWYATWARSPMAARFTRVDWMRLQDIAPLKDRYYRKPTSSMAGELRLQESLFGATVMDRQRLHWRVVPSVPADEGGEPAKIKRLRVVADDAVAGA
jgi:hypothetical protein